MMISNILLHLILGLLTLASVDLDVRSYVIVGQIGFLILLRQDVKVRKQRFHLSGMKEHGK